jgi:type IV secretion system protein VirB11
VAVEVLLNHDGRLQIDQPKEKLVETGERLSLANGERIIRLVPHHVGQATSSKLKLRAQHKASLLDMK